MAEVTLNSSLGRGLYNLIKNTKFNTIVEIGGWDGLGSTLCMSTAIKDSDQDSKIYSIELIKNRHLQAKENYKNNKNIIFLNGSLCGGEIDSRNAYNYLNQHLNEFKEQQKNNLTTFYMDNLKQLKNCRSVFSELPKNIDLLLLDGGEYTTFNEWLTFKQYFNVKYLAMDDTNMLKCKYIVEDILDNDLYKEIILDDKLDRNGCMIFKLK